MKSTGVVRRIDELGRIVIPKEIRRNLGIRDGENIEIFTENDSIILKKYYRMSTSSDLASNLCELVYNNFNYKSMITDREKIIACAGFSADIKKCKSKFETKLQILWCVDIFLNLFLIRVLNKYLEDPNLCEFIKQN